MKKFLVLVLVAMAASGCATRYVTESGQIRTHIFLQRGVKLTIVHSCTDRAKVFQGGRIVGEIYGGEPREFPLDPAVIGDNNIYVTVNSLDSTGKITGIYPLSIPIDRDSTKSHQWIISNNVYGGGNVYINNCR